MVSLSCKCTLEREIQSYHHTFIIKRFYHHIVIRIVVNWLGCHSSDKFLQAAADHFPCQSKCQLNHQFQPTLWPSIRTHTCHQLGLVCFLKAHNFQFSISFTLTFLLSLFLLLLFSKLLAPPHTLTFSAHPGHLCFLKAQNF